MSAADQQTNPQSSSGQTEDNKAVQSNSVLQSAKQSLLQRASMVTESFRDDDCSSFDTCLGRLLKVGHILLYWAPVGPKSKVKLTSWSTG